MSARRLPASYNLLFVLCYVFVFAFKLQITEAVLYGWGANDWGQMGLGNFTSPIRRPQRIAFYEDKNIAQVSVADGYHFAMLDDGRVFCSGNNFYGQLGLGGENRTLMIPTPAENVNVTGCNVIAGINNVNAYCPATKSIKGWGYAAGYMLKYLGQAWYRVWDPQDTQFRGNVESLASVEAGIFVRLENGTVYVKGESANGRLGVGTINNYTSFHKMSFWDDVPLQYISSSQTEHACAIAVNGSLFCWGAGESGQLGQGDTEDRWLPTRVAYFDDEEHILHRVFTGDMHTVALTCGGNIFTFGSNAFGQLGINATTNVTQTTPVHVKALKGKNILGMVMGNNQNFAITDAGDWFVWGGNNGGALGLGTDIDQPYPVQNPVFKELGINYIASGSAAATAFGWTKLSVPTTRVGCPPMVNECLGNNICFDPTKGGECVDTDRNYKCRCKQGYRGDGISPASGGFGCEDIDECESDTDDCVQDAQCVNTEGSYTCTCPTGFHGDGIEPSAGGQGCIKNLDECQFVFPCDINAVCNDTIESYTCQCRPGFIGDGYKPEYGGNGCTDIDECALGHLNCTGNSTCSNLPGSAECACPDGYGGNDCSDIDECDTATDKCSPNAFCQNTVGSYTCTCKDGFYGDGYNCYVIDGTSTSGNNTGFDTTATTDVYPATVTGQSNTIGDLFEYYDHYNNSNGPIFLGEGQGGVSGLDPSLVTAMIALFVSIVGVLIILAIVFSVMVYRRRRYA